MTTKTTLTARDVMSTDLVTVSESTTVGELSSLMIDRQISGVPVQNDAGEIVGVVSLSDIAAVASRSSAFAPDRTNPGYFVAGWEDRFAAEELRYLHIEDEGLTAGEIMTPKVFSVDAGTPIHEVAEMMVSGPLHRVLVMEDGEERVPVAGPLRSRDGASGGNATRRSRSKPVGIVSTLDLVKLLIEK
jgi:CBS domain-containing protein